MGGLYAEYEHIAGHYPGFTLTEIKDLSPRERDYWAEMASWRAKQK